MRFISLALVAVMASAAPAFAQSRDTGDVNVKATEPPIDRTSMQKTVAPSTMKTGVSAESPSGTPANKTTATGGVSGSKAPQ